MLIWRDQDIAAVDAAAASALAGSPRLVVVHGGPGSGRTSFLAAAAERVLGSAVERGTPFSHWTAEGTVKSDTPYQGLADLGVLIERERPGGAPRQAEQELREAIDDALDVGPVLITVDDLQWIDPESVDALARVLDSAVAERLLVIVTTGYFEPFQHLSWQRLVAASPLVVRVELEGLAFDDALEVARDARPGIPEQLVRRLWEHTRGNPLFLSSLLRRNTPDALDRMVQLPAPNEYAHAIEVRLATLGGHAVALARAAAVIGVGWMPLAEAAYVAGVDDVAEALDILVLEFILEQRATDVGTEVRMVHAVIQASIYQNIPAAERVRLHRRAADVAADEPSELRHSYAAATSYDAELAERLEAAADAQHARRSHRTAARYLDWASRLTANGLQRSTRWTGALFEHLLDGNTELVRAALPELRSARDRRGAAVVVGALHVLDNEWRDAIAVLTPVAASGADDLNAYRVEILLAWASMAAGEGTDAAVAPLDRAEALSRRDDSLAGLATFTAALLGRRRGQSRRVRERVDLLPERPSAVPLDDTYWLAWRGIAAIMSGQIEDALAPLHEVQERIAAGTLNVGDGLTNAFLGLGHWLAGNVGLASTQFRIAEELLRPIPNPMSASYAAVGHVITGDREGAMRLLDRARATLREMPWVEGVYALLVGSVIVLQAFGTDAERAALMPGLRADFGDGADSAEGSPIWKLHAALACAWAGEAERAESIARSLEATPDVEWREATVFLVQAVSAEKRGELALAAELYGRSQELWPVALSAFAVQTGYDQARVSAQAGDIGAAGAAADRVRRRYTRLRVVSHFAALDALFPTNAPPASPQASPVADAAPAPLDRSLPPGGVAADGVSAPSPHHATISLPAAFAALSDRELDVAALVVRGMSYAQIARELFISRSTVGFHLSRIYAKTGTTTRHELSDLVRGG